MNKHTNYRQIDKLTLLIDYCVSLPVKVAMQQTCIASANDVTSPRPLEQLLKDSYGCGEKIKVEIKDPI